MVAIAERATKRLQKNIWMLRSQLVRRMDVKHGYLKRYRGKKYYSLIDKVCNLKNLCEAWEKVKANRGSGGVDKVSISQYEANLNQNLREMQRLLREGRYKPLPVRRAYIPKPNKKKRPLGIPTIRDRVVQQALRSVIEPIFEQEFLECSYGFRPGRNCHQAIEKVEEYKGQGNEWVVDADIRAYFDTVNQELLMSLIKRRISDGKVLSLIEAFLRAGVMEDDVWRATNMGTPQGGVISPLMANIYLHSFDLEMKSRGYKIVRYADDFLLLAKSKEEAEDILMRIKEIIEDKLRLELNTEKTKILHVSDGVDFLGFTIYEGHKVPQKKVVKRYKDKVRQITRRCQPINTEEMIRRLNPVIAGWGNYFKIGNVNWLYKGLDSWTRMRVRSFKEKRKSYNANRRITNETLRNKGLRSLSGLLNPAWA